MGEKRKIEDIKKLSDELTKKIIDRIRDLGQVDVMTYRHDRVITESMNRLCALYKEAAGECEHYDENLEPSCRLFRVEPEIIRRLELSEEEICPIRQRKKT